MWPAGRRPGSETRPRAPAHRGWRNRCAAATPLWRSPDFRRLWLSLTITSFGAQVTNLAQPLTASLLLQATPLQMGILVALEALPFALVSLHAGVLLDRVRKLPMVIVTDVSRGAALLMIPVAAYRGWLSVEILYVVGFFCGVQNVVGGAAYQVLLAQLAGRKRWSRRTPRSRWARRAPRWWAPAWRACSSKRSLRRSRSWSMR